MIAIFAPHVDDEVIGCWSLLERSKDDHVMVIYNATAVLHIRIQEAREAGEYLGFEPIFPVNDLNKTIELVLNEDKPTICWAPDPHWERHPAHKETGAAVRNACRRHCVPFGTYSTSMNVPYLRELSPREKDKKKQALETYYPSQRTLWEYDHRYFLFEGMAEWNPR